MVKNGKIFIFFHKKNSSIILNRKVTIRTEPISIPNNLLASTQTCKFKRINSIHHLINFIN